MKRPILVGVGVVLLVGVACGLIVWRVIARGFSARDQPSRVEAFVARQVRRLSVPSSARSARNPVPKTQAAIADGMAHFADHCASCHANDGSGQTAMGGSLYPKAPDMRLTATQQLSDGELFYVIENGIRLTGMPAWSTGTPEGEEASWTLVRFIHHLPTLSAEEVEAMSAMNPRSLEEFRQEEAERRFLAGEVGTPAHTPGPSHKHPGGER